MGFILRPYRMGFIWVSIGLAGEGPDKATEGVVNGSQFNFSL